MAEIRPIRAWRYRDDLPIDELTSPLFDVVSEKQRAALYKNPFNSIHLSVPEGPNPAQRAKKLLAEWKRDETLVWDRIPGLYVYYQYYSLAGSMQEYCRKGFVAHIRVYDWSEHVILPHENTIPKAVNDRIDLLRETELHVSATHGLYTDPEKELERYMDEAITAPIYETEDYQGVRDVLAVIHDAKVIQLFIDTIREKQVILADGHHRYESSLELMHQKKKENAAHSGQEGYNFHLMYLTNTETGNLRILPTHRLIRNLHSFNEAQTLKKLQTDFIIKPLEDPDTVNEVIHGKQWAFGLLFRESAYKIRLKPESFHKLKWPFPDIVKALDLTVMHYFIIEQVLGIPGKEQRTSDNIDFDRSFSDCLAKVIRGQAQMALITQEIPIETVKAVCESGSTMPQKSTYFYPKVICGFLFSSIKENEFREPPYSRF